MHSFRPSESLDFDSIGHHHPPGSGGRGGSESHPAALAGGLSVELCHDPFGMGSSGESETCGCHGPLRDTDSRVPQNSASPGARSRCDGRACHGPEGRLRGTISTGARAVALSLTLGLLRFYQVGVSALIPSACRYSPTCSTYACEAIQKYGVRQGVALGLRRLWRCRPFGPYGYDPVP